MKYIPELDGLRGIAAVSVVALHWQPEAFFWGWAGVNLFFVLSGYLIGTIVLEAVLERRFSPLQFYYRRTLRIWPVYYAALAAILCYHLVVQGGAFFDSKYFSDWLRSLVFLQFTPFYTMPGVDPNQIFDFLPGMLPIWSLAVEEQFYLLLPALLLLLVPRIGIRATALLLLAIAVMAPVMRLEGYVPVLLITQADGLMLGVILAAITAQGGDRVIGSISARRIYAIMVVFGSVMLMPYLLSGYRGNVDAEDLFSNPLLWTWANILFFGIIGMVVDFSGSRFVSALRSRPLLYLGSISYALYMFHYPLLAFIKPRLVAFLGPDLYWLAMLLTGVLIIGLPHLSKVYLERPILSLKDRFPVRLSDKSFQVAG